LSDKPICVVGTSTLTVMTSSVEPTVLIVEDDANLADLYAEMIADSCEVQIANSGEEAIELLTDKVDVVLLDRRMPKMSGDEVLAKIRDRDIDCRVAMVTAFAPDYDVLDMEFDQYIEKPVSPDDLSETIDELLSMATHHGKIQECYSIAARLSTLQNQKTDAELEVSDKYSELRMELAQLQQELHEELGEMDTQDGIKLPFQEIVKEDL
jgi:two-component system response regulator AdeR